MPVPWLHRYARLNARHEIGSGTQSACIRNVCTTSTQAMSASSRVPAGAPAVAELARHLVAVERLCAREVALRVVAGTDTVRRPNDEARTFYWLAAHMVSAKLEVDKWEPLFTAMQRHVVGGLDAVQETERVWTPVYHAMQTYKDARFHALRGGTHTQDAGVRAAASEPPAATGSGITTGIAGSVAATTGSAARSGSQARGVGHVPTTLVLPRMQFEHGEPVFTTLMQSFGASSLGVRRPSVQLPPPAAPAEVNAGSAVARSDVSATAPDTSVSDDVHRAHPVYDRKLLARTADTLRQAGTDLDTIVFERISAWAAPRLDPEAREAANASFGTVTSAADVSRALDHCATEVRKPLVAVDQPHKDIFSALGIGITDPPAATQAAPDDCIDGLSAEQ